MTGLNDMDDIEVLRRSGSLVRLSRALMAKGWNGAGADLS